MVKAWKKYKIGDCLIFKNGLNKGKEFFGTGTPIVNYMDVYKKRGLRASDLKGMVSLSRDEIRRFEAQKGDVFFTRTSETSEEIGYSSVLLDDIENCVFSGFVLRGRPINDLLDEGYCQYCFMTPDVRNAIVSGCTYTTRALTNGKQLSAIEFHIPPKPEQTEIAKVLSEMDTYIVTLEKLIAKKKAIKIGAMQELLTGKRRLKGFTGEWKKKTLGTIGDITGAGVDKKTVQNELPIILLNYLDVYRNTYICREMLSHTVTATQEKINQCNIRKGDVFLTPTSETPNDIARTAVAVCDMFDVVYSYHLTRLRPYDGYHGEFIKFACDTKDFCEQAERMSEGSGTRYVISLTRFRELAILLPPTEKEQIAIAEILFDMHAEIEALTAKLNKSKAIKVGTMQQLLTGQIRLVETVEDEDAAKQRDAITYAGIVDIWGRQPDRYPLGRVKVMKLFYFFTRKIGGNIDRFHEHAAGPYDETIRYGGGELIAVIKDYIEVADRGDASRFTCGANIDEAKKQLYSEDMITTLQWLADNFRTTTVEELELIATVDMARVKIEMTGCRADAKSIVDYISNSENWKPKLSRAEFHISNIAAALKQSRELFDLKGD